MASSNDDFSYLVAAQTFASGHLTNPPHAHWEFFETPHVLMQPSYMAKYPPLQGLVMALGILLGHPIIGIWLVTIGFALASTWAFRAALSTHWSLLGGLFVALAFGGGHRFAQTYWSGSPAALGGALVLGAVLRLWRMPSLSAAFAYGLGANILILCRPYEGLVLLIVLSAPLGVRWFSQSRTSTVERTEQIRCVGIIAILGVLGLAFLLRYNTAVTGSPWQLPYTLYEKQYSGAPMFYGQSWQPAPEFRHSILKNLYYLFTVPGSKYPDGLVNEWVNRNWAMLRFFPGDALIGFVLIACWLRPRVSTLLPASGILLVSVAAALSYWFNFHYVSLLAPCFVLLALEGLHYIHETVPPAARWRRLAFLTMVGIGCVVAARSYSLRRPVENPHATTRHQYEQQFREMGGQHLVFVHTPPNFVHYFIWVYNEADIDTSQVVWAHDMGVEKNQQLIDYYRGTRHLWWLEARGEEQSIQPITTIPVAR